MSGVARRLAGLARLAGVLGALAVLLAPGSAAAQEATGVEVLVVDAERILEESRSGQAMMAAFEAERVALAAETTEIATALEEEELRLTQLRADLPRADFEVLAAEFDARVRRARAERDQEAESLTRRIEAERLDFFRRLAPIYQQIIIERGAVALLDLRSVILADARADITAEVIRRLDAEGAPALDDTSDGN